MLKQSFKILVLFVSLFVVIANVGYSVVALDSEQSVEVNNSCCGDSSLANSCCEVKTDGCETNKLNSCCCSEMHQTVQFSFNAPIEQEVKESVLQPLIVTLDLINHTFDKSTFLVGRSLIYPPPKIGVRLSFLQTYRI
ncbi:MAG: hypothetical protein QNK68_08505 [Flavobacteriales bacterium]|jgi:hypothetical protein|tara:strand:- start:2774 stop:3187 length:414 start_codon:yes stop_codon:yes gene_type:complete